MSDVTVYSASSVNIVFGGILFTGLGSGDDAVQVERNEPAIDMKIGIQGDGTLSQSTDKSGRVLVRLLAGSATNALLSAKANAGDAGVVFSAPLVITEAGTNGKATASKAVIEKTPNYVRGKTAQEVVWAFISHDIDIVHASGSEL